MPMPHVDGKAGFYVKVPLADVKRALWAKTNKLGLNWGQDIWEEKDVKELPAPPRGQRWIAVELRGLYYWMTNSPK